MDQEKATVVQSHMSFVNEIAVLITEIFLGYIMEVLGRKIPSIIGLTVSGLALIASPLPQNTTGLYILRVMAGIGLMPLCYSPY